MKMQLDNLSVWYNKKTETLELYGKHIDHSSNKEYATAEEVIIVLKKICKSLEKLDN